VIFHSYVSLPEGMFISHTSFVCIHLFLAATTCGLNLRARTASYIPSCKICKLLVDVEKPSICRWCPGKTGKPYGFATSTNGWPQGSSVDPWWFPWRKMRNTTERGDLPLGRAMKSRFEASCCAWRQKIVMTFGLAQDVFWELTLP
jgi:hypothetical protein